MAKTPPTIASSKRSSIRSTKPVLDSGVQTPALDRALALLEFISSHPEGVTTSDIRAGLGFSTNLVFRLTKALTIHGYIERSEAGGLFYLTRKLLTLAQPKREERSLVQIAWEPMRWLRDVSGESSHIGVRSGFECIVLDRVIGPNPFKCYVEAGAHGPLHSGAPGKVMLAWLPAEELKRTLQEMPLARLTPQTITSKDEFEQHLQTVRQNGYATDLSEGIDGMHCLAAPIFDHDDRPIASVWITSLSQRLNEGEILRLAPYVLETAQRITAALKA